MADSDITITDLTPTSGTQSIKWTWEVVGNPGTGVQDYVQYETTEIWTASVNNRNLATKAGEGISDFTQYGLTRGEIVFAWARARTKGIGPNGERYYGEWSEGTTNGVEGREASGDVLLEENGYWKLPSGLIYQWGRVVSADPIALVTFPIPFPNGVFNVVATVQGGFIDEAMYSAAVDNIQLAEFDLYARFALTNVISGDTAVDILIGHTVFWQAIGY